MKEIKLAVTLKIRNFLAPQSVCDETANILKKECDIPFSFTEFVSVEIIPHEKPHDNALAEKSQE